MAIQLIPQQDLEQEMFRKLPLPIGFLDSESHLKHLVLLSFSFVGGRQISIPVAV